MTVQEQISVTAPLVAFPFQTTDVPDAAGTMVTLQATTESYAMPWEGSVVAIGAVSNADFTGGVVTFNPTIGGTADTSLAAVLSDTVQSHTGRCAVGAVPFAQGALLGCKWTESGTVAPTTNDISVVLFVQFRGAFTGG